MKSFLLVAQLASELAAKYLSTVGDPPLDFTQVETENIDYMYTTVKSVKPPTGRNLLSCSSWSNISLDLTSFANANKNYYASQVTRTFTATDNTGG